VKEEQIVKTDYSIFDNVTIPETKSVPGNRKFTKTEPLPELQKTFTVSARQKSPKKPIFAYLRENYGNVRLREIESVFGFVERSELYGGRIFEGPELSGRDVVNLNRAGIGLRIPMSNHFVGEHAYRLSESLLARHHNELNSIIITNDDLARWIRKDFPRYRLDASVIKNIKTHRKIDEALELYDSVVLPMPLNEDLDFLEKIEAKDKIILFANAGCALTCPSRLCYRSVSKINNGTDNEWQCSLPLKERERYGMVDFPLQPYIDLGFHQFKLLRSRPNGITGF
jgi:hypothetical protein